MRNFHLRSPLVRVSAISLATSGLLAVLLPVTPQSAQALEFFSSKYKNNPRHYERCAAGLTGAGVAEADAAAACAGALYPTDLSTCVTNIKSNTSIAANDALSGCRRVRRPVEMGKCVVDINNVASDGTVALDVLDNCRRSLLPARFSACVVGLLQEISFSTSAAMTDCIAASSRPRNVLPSFVPAAEGVPTTPSREGDNMTFPNTPFQAPTAPMQSPSNRMQQ